MEKHDRKHSKSVLMLKDPLEQLVGTYASLRFLVYRCCCFRTRGLFLRFIHSLFLERDRESRAAAEMRNFLCKN